jgi:hypothetical protein
MSRTPNRNRISRCADCGVKATGVLMVPSTGEGPTQAQIEKLKPTVYLSVECAEERGLSFNRIAIERTGGESLPSAP